MSKRFTDTNKYKKPFIRGLPGAYKLLWDYLYLDCDHAGIWIVDFEIAQLYIGADMPINKEDALKYFNNGEQRIIEFDKNKKWFIPSFIEFQYGELKPGNKLHDSVINILKKYNIYENKPLASPSEGAKKKEKDKDKDKDKDYKKEKETFDEFRKIYPGIKRGNDVEFDNFIKKTKDWKEVLPLLSKRVEYQKEARKVRKNKNMFNFEWKILSTWINNRCWEEIINTEE